MFLLPSIALGLIFAALLGGRLERLLEVHFAAAWSVFLALAIQIVLFTAISPVPPAVAAALHIGSHGLLLVFAIANRRFVALAPVMLGMLLNGVVIAVNGGSMPVTRTAARAAGLMPSDYESVSEHARSLRFLGDVFAIPSSLPLSNTFSVGDLLIRAGAVPSAAASKLSRLLASAPGGRLRE